MDQTWAQPPQQDRERQGDHLGPHRSGPDPASKPEQTPFLQDGWRSAIALIETSLSD